MKVKSKRKITKAQRESDHRRAARRYAEKMGRPVPEWAMRKPKKDPLAEPKEITKAAIDYARYVAKRKGLPVPPWAAYAEKRDYTVAPIGREPTYHEKTLCRKQCLKENKPFPDWAKYATKDPLAEPVIPTEYRRRVCRFCCECRGIEVPEWAKQKKESRDMTAMPSTGATKYAVQQCRSYCQKRGIPIPDWAKTERDDSTASGRNKFCAAGALCHIDLGLFSGMDCFWNKALFYASFLQDPILYKRILERNEQAHDEAYRVCREIDPLFGNHIDSADGIDHRQFNTSNMVKGNKQQYVAAEREQSMAWDRFCTENNIINTSKNIFWKGTAK